MTLTRILRLACDGCGYGSPEPRPWRRVRPFYPTADGGAMCDRCAYDRGMLSGREARRYAWRHPLMTAWLALRRRGRGMAGDSQRGGEHGRTR